MKSDLKRVQKSKKDETECGALEINDMPEINEIPEINPDEIIIDNINYKINNEDSKIMRNSMKDERSIFDLVKIKDVYNQSKRLNLEMVSQGQSENIKERDIIEITPLGYAGSKRKKDGITFFGCVEEGKNNEVDVCINPRDNEELNEKFYGINFQIKFNPDDKNYYLKDLGKGLGTFIKIKDSIEIQNNYILNIGNNYLTFALNENKENDNKLSIRIFSNLTTQKDISILPKDSPFTIGRRPENKIYIEDYLLSRVHCTIEYINNKWYIKDGGAFQKNELNKSTNGCWILAYKDTLITDKMIFKDSYHLYECNLIDIGDNISDTF